MRVLVLDGNNRVALAVVRALGMRGCHITVAEQKPFAHRYPAAFYSRYVHKRIVLPSFQEKGGILHALEKLRADVDVVVPVSTNTVLFCAKHRGILDSWGLKMFFAPLDEIQRANNKAWLTDFAKLHDFATPQTWHPLSWDEVHNLKSQLPFPVVIKLVDDEGLYLNPEERYAIVSDARQFEATYKHFHDIKPFPLVQEYIEGNSYGFSALAEKGEVLAFFCHRRLREYPLTGGPSTLCISIYDEPLVELGKRLLGALKWTGVAMVEFKKDAKDGRYKLLELNPRFWGTLPLAVACGVNFPYLWCLRAQGEKVSWSPPYPVGRKMQFRASDALAVLSASRNGQRLQRVVDFVYHCGNPKVQDGVLDFQDIRSSLAYLIGRLL